MRHCFQPSVRAAILFNSVLLVGCMENRTPPPPAMTIPPPEAKTVDAPKVDQPAATVQANSTTRRPGIYDSTIPPDRLIAQAVEQAKQGHKRVLIEWGFNSCVWCVRLHETFHNDALVHPILEQNYILVLIDGPANLELLQHYGGKDRNYSYPHLTVLDESGEVVTNQNTEPLEEGKGHSPQAVADFLTKWQPSKSDAAAGN
jgi:hypothetical protein